MATASGMSRSTVARIWRAFGLKPHLYAALDLASGLVISQMTPRHRAIKVERFRARIDQTVPATLDVHVICDNFSTHYTPEIRRWLLAHPRFQLHFTPT